MLSFWTMVLAGLVGFSSLFVPLGALEAGWTGYPTLSTTIGAPGHGETMWAITVFLIGASSIMGGINYITTIVRLRAPGRLGVDGADDWMGGARLIVVDPETGAPAHGSD